MALQQIESYDDMMDILGVANVPDFRAEDLAEMLIHDRVEVMGAEVYSNDLDDKDYIELVIRIPK